jgi:hypothetical protein
MLILLLGGEPSYSEKWKASQQNTQSLPSPLDSGESLNLGEINLCVAKNLIYMRVPKFALPVPAALAILIDVR